MHAHTTQAQSMAAFIALAPPMAAAASSSPFSSYPHRPANGRFSCCRWRLGSARRAFVRPDAALCPASPIAGGLGGKEGGAARCFPVCCQGRTGLRDAREWRGKLPAEIRVLVAGSTGYVGRFVVGEMVERGYQVVAVARERSGVGGRSGRERTVRELQGADVCFADVAEKSSLNGALAENGTRVDVVISCLASRTGGVEDSWKIDYEAAKTCLEAGLAAGASHFVLLSAICVQKPLLEFQRAKLKFEAELQTLGESGDLTYSIVRPTAFFKSLGGQVETVKNGKPYIMFGDGALCACKPISEADLASFIANCVSDEDKINKVLPIGGPGKALTPREQGEMLFRVLGKEPKFLQVPIGVMDFGVRTLDFLAQFFPSLEDAAEFGRIGRYYATESMLLYDPETGKYDENATPSYGNDTLDMFFDRVIREGMAGQELGDQAVFKSSWDPK